MPQQNHIIQVIFDIWFESDVPGEALLGDAIKKFGLSNVQELPLLSAIPEFIRKNDPNFKYQPIYELFKESADIKILIGTYSIGLTVTKYESWEESIKPYIQKINELLHQISFIKKPIRMGLKYINFFDNENVFETRNIEIKINGTPKRSELITLKIDDKETSPKTGIAIRNHQQIKIGNQDKSGSIAEIVAYEENFELTSISDIAESLHNKIKQLYGEIAQC